MKLRKMITMASVLCICFAMMGCSETKGETKPSDNSVVENEAGQNNAAEESAEEIADEDAPEIIETEAEETPATITYEASKEIKEAALSSGYIQIGNEIFRNGGYITLGEFIEKYSEKYEFNIDAAGLAEEVKYKSYRFVEATEKGTGLPMEMIIGLPVAGKGTIADGVIICFRPHGEPAFTNSWGPGGICYICPDRDYDSIISMYKDQECKEIEDPFPRGLGVTANKMQENINSYYGSPASDEQKYDKAGCFIEADDENLYGVKPVFVYFYSNFREEPDHVYFHINWFYYDANSEVYQWS